MRNPASWCAEGGAGQAAGAAASRPWYREPWPWILMSGPVAVVVAGFATLWIAVKSDDGLVVDDYYKQGLAIHRVLERDRTAAQLAVGARVEAAQGRVRVVLTSAGPALPDALTLYLVHPTRGGRDQKVSLSGAGGIYYGRLAPPEPGRWLLTLEDPGRTWRVVGEMTVPAQGAAELRPSAPE